MLNLHAMVRGCITSNLPDASFTLFRSCGQTNVKGIKTAVYEKIEGITGSFQSEGDAALNFAEKAGQNTVVRKLYINAPNDKQQRAWSVYRPLSRGGDYIQDADGMYWLINSVIEDFSEVGWECVRCTLVQGDPPNITLKD